MRTGNKWTIGAIAAALATAIATPAQAAAPPIEMQVLSIADFHSQLDPAKADEGGQIVGANGEKLTVTGAAYVAAHLKRLRAKADNSILIGNGDLVSGAPFAGDVFRDEPTIEVMNRFGLAFSNIGNHELDVSDTDLFQHIRRGECDGEINEDSCFTDSTGKRFRGADYDYLSANVTENGEPIADPYYITEVAGAHGRKQKVGFINITTPGTETGPSSFQPHLKTSATVETADRYAKELTDQGVNAIVLNVHDGAKPVGGHQADYNGCDMESGPLLDVAATVSPDIDAIVGGHLHYRFNCSLPDPAGNLRPVIEPGRYGDVINEINLSLDPRTGEVLRDQTRSANRPTTHDIAPDPRMQKVVDYWGAKADARGERAVATVAGDLPLTPNEAGESAFGDLAADVNLATANRTAEGEADFGLVATAVHKGSKSIKQDLLVAKGDRPGDADGLLVEREAWSDGYGYGDPFLTVTLTGAQIDAAFEQQWTDTKFAPLAVSHNVSYAFDDSRPIGDRVDPADFVIDGAALDPDGRYRVAVMSYTALGQDGFPALAGFTHPYRVQPADHEAFIDYCQDAETLTPGPLDRVTAK